MTERRVPMQGDGAWWCYPSHPTWRERPTKVPGTVTWDEHVEIWRAYAALGHGSQDAEICAARGGFSFYEATTLLGREPRTWRPRE